MKAHPISIVLILFSLFFSFNIALANSVLINEIAWMGTEVSANKEWIELFNKTNQDISLENYTLLIDEKQIKLKGIIKANDFYILERTSDDTLPNIKADLIYTGAIKNTGVKITLKDNNQNIIDEADFSQGWTAGDNKTKQTAERIENTWQTSIEKGGSPKAPNIKNTQPEKKEEKQEKQTAPLGQASLEEVIQETNFPIKTMLQISFVSSLIAVFIKRQYT